MELGLRHWSNLQRPSSGIWICLPNCQAHGVSVPPSWNTGPWPKLCLPSSLSGVPFLPFVSIVACFLAWQSIWCQSQSESWVSGTWHVGRQIIKRHFPPLLCSLALGKQKLMKLTDVKGIVLWEGVVLSRPFHRPGKQRTRERTRPTQNK